MLTKVIKRAIIDPQWQTATLPPTFLLPLRARLTTITNSTSPEPPPDSLQKAGIYNYQPNKPIPSPLYPPSPNDNPSPPPPSPQKTPSPTISALLPLLRSQPPHYITAHIHARPYLLTAGDTLRLPFNMPDVLPGDILRLTRASSIGSRDYTLTGAPYVDENLFECRAVVLGVETEPMRVIEKTKRRQRKVKRVKSKHRFTLLKVREVTVRGDGEEGMDGYVLGSAEGNVIATVTGNLSGNAEGVLGDGTKGT